MHSAAIREPERVRSLFAAVGAVLPTGNPTISCFHQKSWACMAAVGDEGLVSITQTLTEGITRTSVNTVTGIEHKAIVTAGGSYFETEQQWSIRNCGAYGPVGILNESAHRFTADDIRQMAETGMKAVRQTLPMPALVDAERRHSCN